MSIPTEITRLETAKANIKAAIESKGVTVPSSTTLDGYPSLISTISGDDPYNGHDYVEIGGLKWATMNIGATGVTDYGLYFQWGDTAGYAASQVGSGEGQKPFQFKDYKFGNGTTSDNPSAMTKYNSADTKTTLEMCDDAAHANWGGAWRLPTVNEFKTLGNAIDYIDIDGNVITAKDKRIMLSGVMGIYVADKTDHSKRLFFPAAGGCNGYTVQQVGEIGYYCSSSRHPTSPNSIGVMFFTNTDVAWNGYGIRYQGCSLRAVVDE